MRVDVLPFLFPAGPRGDSGWGWRDPLLVVVLVFLDPPGVLLILLILRGWWSWRAKLWATSSGSPAWAAA